MSDTPRSDAQVNEEYQNWEGNDWVPLYFARQLERELAAMTRERDALKEKADKYDFWRGIKRAHGEPIRKGGPCACQFESESDDPVSWCSYHAELRAEVERLRELLREVTPDIDEDGPQYVTLATIKRIRAALGEEER